MKLTRAPVLAALALLLTFAGTAQATLVTAKFSGPMKYGPAGAVAFQNEYVGPYWMQVTHKSGDVPSWGPYLQTALPCLTSEQTVSWGSSWTAFLAKGDDSYFATTGLKLSKMDKPMKSEELWKSAWISNQYLGDWSNAAYTLDNGVYDTNYDKWVPADPVTTSSVKVPWGTAHFAIWDLTLNTPLNAGTYQSQVDQILADASAAYTARQGAGLVDADLANMWVLVPGTDWNNLGTAQDFLAIMTPPGTTNVDPDVPEPSTWALLLMGVAGVARRRRRRTTA